MLRALMRGGGRSRRGAAPGERPRHDAPGDRRARRERVRFFDGWQSGGAHARPQLTGLRPAELDARLLSTSAASRCSSIQPASAPSQVRPRSLRIAGVPTSAERGPVGGAWRSGGRWHWPRWRGPRSRRSRRRPSRGTAKLVSGSRAVSRDSPVPPRDPRADTRTGCSRSDPRPAGARQLEWLPRRRLTDRSRLSAWGRGCAPLSLRCA
jgi:hypothetical protein